MLQNATTKNSQIKLYKTAIWLALIGFSLALLGCLTGGAYAWLFLYMPFLWFVWIFCVFALNEEMRLIKLFKLWVLINFSILLLFISFALKVQGWANAKSIEIVVCTAYFPVVVPIGFLGNLVSHDAKHIISNNFDSLARLFGGEAGDAVAVWLFMSGLASIQSLILVCLSQFILKQRNRHTKAVRP